MLQTTLDPTINPAPQAIRPALHRLSALFIQRMTDLLPAAREGVVMTPGPKPYRRLDCDGRALAYIRVRPRKRVVRIDVSGLWVVARDAAIRHASASGSATLFLETDADIEDACTYLVDTIARTRAAYAAERERQSKKASKNG